MKLKCKLDSGAEKIVAIPFNPPLSGYDEVKPRLLAMRAEAQQALGMVRARHSGQSTHVFMPPIYVQALTPQITSFRMPPDLLFTISFMSLLIYCTFAPRGTGSLWFRPAEVLVNFAGGERSVKYSWIIVFVTHPLESIYTFVLCRRHRTPFFVGVSFLLILITNDFLIVCLVSGGIHSRHFGSRLSHVGRLSKACASGKNQFH